MSWRCPRCENAFDEKSRAFPFCCDRCKLIDLGAWASGAYCIPGARLEEEELEATGLSSAAYAAMNDKTPKEEF